LPKDEENVHSGAGRILRVNMRPMTWFELGWSDGKVSLSALLSKNSKIKSGINELGVKKIAERVCVGGWPINIDVPPEKALMLNQGYTNLISEAEIGENDKKYRDSLRVRKFIESYARNIATPAKMTTIISDVLGEEKEFIAPITGVEYRKSLTNIMVVEDLPVWPTHIRSSAKLRQTPKRHFVDPSIATAALSLTPDMLIDDLNYLGFLFESAVLRDIRVYAELVGADVYYYRDTDGDEIDIVVEKRSGEWALFEVKLSANREEEGAEQIKDVLAKITDKKKQKLMSKNIIVGVGNTYVRSDGINVISLANLGA
jgi:predicted AAA+ superfamily ATPase